MADDLLVSLNAKLYWGTAGATAATELDIVGDVNLKMSKGEATTTFRRSRFKLTKTTLVEASIGFQIPWLESEPAFAAMFDAFVNGTPLAFKILAADDGDYGMDADFEVVKFDEGQPIEGGITADIEIKPTYAGNSPRLPEFLTA